MTSKRLPWWVVGGLACILLLLAAVLIFFQFRSGIHVAIHNAGSQPLNSVLLHVTGASYDLGDIASGETAEATVHPEGESHLEIEFIDAGGQANRLNAGGYFETGGRGTIDISIKDGVIQANEQNIKTY